MPALDRNRKKSSTEGIMDAFNDALQDSVSSGLTSVFKDNALAKDVNEMLNLKDNATQFLQRDQIYPNPLNEPYMQDITDSEFDTLKASILDIGLMHNLVVIEDGTGKYRLISGEKRWTAIHRMSEGEYQKGLPNGVEAKILPYNPDLSKSDEKIMLLTCNVLTFSNGSPDSKQLRDLIRLYEKKGYEKKDLVEFLNHYLKKNEKTMYKLIAEAHAIDELLALYDNNILSRSALQHLGGLPVEDQHNVIALIKEGNLEKIDEATALQLKKIIKDSSSSKTNGTISFLKLDKAFKSAKSDLTKCMKFNVEGMSETELQLSIANLDLIANTIKDLKDKLQKGKDSLNNKK